MKTTNISQKLVLIVIGTFFAVILSIEPSFSQHIKVDNANVAISPGTFITMSGNVALKNSGTIDNSGTIRLQGDWLNSGNGLINNSPGTVELNGSAQQVLGGNSTTKFNNLNLVNSTDVQFNYHEEVNGQLTISGPVYLNSWILTLGANAPPIVPDVGSLGPDKMLICNNGYAGGEVRKLIDAPGSYTFPVGDNTGTAEYSPITVNITSGTFDNDANVAVKVVNTKHPNNHSPSSYLNRFWHVTQGGITSFSGNITGNYVVADVAGTESVLSTGKWNGHFPWEVLGGVNTATHAISGTFNALSDFTGIDAQANNVIPLSASCSATANASCFHAADGSATVTASGGTWPYSYQWNTNPAQTTETATGLKKGSYTVTVTDFDGATAQCTVVITEPAFACPVVSFTLVNSSTETDIRPLNANDTINLYCVHNINIRADVSSGVGSVRFKLNNNSNFRTENAAPYALAGDNNGNYYNWNVSAGLYTLTATSYTGANAGGTEGQPMTITLLITNTPCNDNDACTDDVCSDDACKFPDVSCDDNISCSTDGCDSQTGCTHAFSAGCCATDAGCDDGDNCTIDVCSANQCSHVNANGFAITSFTLVDADSENDIGPLNNGSVIYLGLSPHVNVRANLCTNAGTGSVKFSLNGNQFKIENVAPYALAGDASGNYYQWNVSPGSYAINAVPYSGANATGTAGTGKTVNITVVTGSAKMSLDEANGEIESKETYLNAYPNPFSEKLNIEFTLAKDSRVKLEIFSITGQKLATLFEGDVKAEQLQKIEYVPATVSGSMIIYRLQTDTESYYGKAVMAK